MPRAKITFTGHITTRTPLTVNRADAKKSSSEGPSLLPRVGFSLKSPPLFPVTSLKGAIRRTAYKVCQTAWEKDNPDQPFTIDDFYMLAQGTNTRGTGPAGIDPAKDAKANRNVFSDDQLRDHNPMLSVFGRWGMTGRWGVENAYPGEDSIFVNGAGFRINDYTRPDASSDGMRAEDVERLQEIMTHQAVLIEEGGEITKLLKDAKKAIMNEKDPEEKSRLAKVIDDLEEKQKIIKSGVEVIQRPIAGYEAIKPGTPMKHIMRLQPGSDIELGLMLATLRYFAANPELGGHESHCCGMVDMEYTAKTWQAGQTEATILGKVGFDEDRFYIEDEPGHTLLSDSLKAWDEAIATPGTFDFKKYQLTA